MLVQPDENEGARPAPAASLSSIDIPIRRPHDSIAKGCRPQDGEPQDRDAQVREPATPTPINDDDPVVRPRRFPSAVPGPASGAPDTTVAEPLPARVAHDDREIDDERVAPAAVIDLWEHLAANRLRPKLSDMDAVTIARQWPNSLLLRVRDDERRPTLEVAHMFVPTAGGPTNPIPIDAMTVDWIVALGREVVATRAPIHETDAVPTGAGAINCGVIALPFGPETCVDHVLCHLYRVDETTIEGDAVVENRLPARDRTGIKRLFGR